MTLNPQFNIGDRVEQYTGPHRYKGRVMDITTGEDGLPLYHVRTDGKSYRNAPMIKTDGFGWRLTPTR